MCVNPTVNADSPRPTALGRLALAAILAGSLATADAALADRACVATNPLLLCSVAECITLQAGVTAACKSPAPTSCNRISGCSPLRAMKGRWLSCAIARDTINARCWGGGDPGHQQASAQAWQNVGNCEARIALPMPVGCADPCPWIPGFTGAPPAAISAPAKEATGEETHSEQETLTEQEMLGALIPVIQALAKQGQLTSLFANQASSEPNTEPAAAGDEASSSRTAQGR